MKMDLLKTVISNLLSCCFIDIIISRNRIVLRGPGSLVSLEKFVVSKLGPAYIIYPHNRSVDGLLVSLTPSLEMLLDQLSKNELKQFQAYSHYTYEEYVNRLTMFGTSLLSREKFQALKSIFGTNSTLLSTLTISDLTAHITIA